MTDPDRPHPEPAAPLPWGMILLSVVALAAIGVGSRWFPSLDETRQEQALRIGIVALMAASLALVNGAAGQFSLGHAAFQGVGAYAAAAAFALAFSNANGEFPASDPFGGRNPVLVGIGARGAILFGGLVAAAVGWLVALPCLRLRGDYLAVVTLGFNVIVGVVIRSLGKVGRVDLRGSLGFNEIPANVAGGFLDIYLTLALSLILLERLIHRGRGLAFATVRDDEIAAEAVGVSTTRAKVAAFVVSSFLAGLAGGLYAFKMGAINDVAFDAAHSFDYVVMVILGGNGSLIGAILAAAGLTILNDRLRSFETWRPVAYSFALVWIMVSRTPGLIRHAFDRPRRSAESDQPPSLDTLKTLALPPTPGLDRPVLAISGMSVRFGGITAVDSLDLQVLPGECVGLIGPNGAGKSTIFNAITGVYRPSSGDVSVDGGSIVGLRPNAIVARGAARTFQNIRLFGSLSALDNVRAAAWSRHRGGLLSAFLPTLTARRNEAATLREARAWIAALGLSGRENDRAASLPYGAQRRLEIARALATGPRLLLLDEPAAGMNPSEKRELTALLRKIHRTLGVSILLIEHDLGVVSDVCSRVVVLDYGKKIAEGPPGAIRSDPRVVEAYLGPESLDPEEVAR